MEPLVGPRKGARSPNAPADEWPRLTPPTQRLGRGSRCLLAEPTVGQEFQKAPTNGGPLAGSWAGNRAQAGWGPACSAGGGLGVPGAPPSSPKSPHVHSPFGPCPAHISSGCWETGVEQPAPAPRGGPGSASCAGRTDGVETQQGAGGRVSVSRGDMAPSGIQTQECHQVERDQNGS